MADWQDPTTPLIWLTASCTLFLVFAIALYFLFRTHLSRVRRENEERLQLLQRHQEELLRSQIESQEKERARIAADLHDHLMAQLQGIQLVNTDRKIADKLTDCMQLARSISHDLTPPLLEKLPIPELFTDVLFPLHQTHEVQFTHNDTTGQPLTPTTKLQLFRIFQEVITNCIRHAHASVVQVEWRHTPSSITLRIQDNGIGLQQGKVEGLGSKNIESRVKILQGRYRFQTAPSGGAVFLFHTKQF